MVDGVVSAIDKVKGKSLDAIVSMVKDRHTKEFPVLSKTVPRLSAEKRYRNFEPASNNHVAQFYQAMAQAWFGGKSDEYVREYVKGDLVYESRPDLVNNKLIADQKGIGSGTTERLRDRQLADYHYLQFLSPHKEVRFQIFRHDIDDMFEDRKKSKEVSDGFVSKSRLHLFEELSVKTKMCVDVSNSVVTALWWRIVKGINHRRWEFQNLNGDGYQVPISDMNPEDEVLRYVPPNSGEEADPWYRFEKTPQFHTGLNSAALNALFYSPKDVLRSVGLSPDLFTFRSHMSPADMMVEGFKVEPFPILQIRDKNHWAWVQYLVTTYHPERLHHLESDNMVPKMLSLIRKNYISEYKRSGVKALKYHDPRFMHKRTRFRAGDVPF